MQEMQEMQVQSLSLEMATHSSVLAWEIPWTSSYSPQDCKELDKTELTHKQASVSL